MTSLDEAIREKQREIEIAREVRKREAAQTREHQRQLAALEKRRQEERLKWMGQCAVAHGLQTLTDEVVDQLFAVVAQVRQVEGGLELWLTMGQELTAPAAADWHQGKAIGVESTV